jgi:hypothetical protein
MLNHLIRDGDIADIQIRAQRSRNADIDDQIRLELQNHCLGADRREDLADTLSFDLILVTEDGRVLYTEGLADSFAPAEEGNYSYEVIF